MTMNDIDDADPGILVNNHMFVKELQTAVDHAPRETSLLKSNMLHVLRDRCWTDHLEPHSHRRIRYTPEQFLKFIGDPRPDGLESDVDTIRRFLGDGPERVAFEQAIDRG